MLRQVMEDSANSGAAGAGGGSATEEQHPPTNRRRQRDSTSSSSSRRHPNESEALLRRHRPTSSSSSHDTTVITPRDPYYGATSPPPPPGGQGTASTSDFQRQSYHRQQQQDGHDDDSDDDEDDDDDDDEEGDYLLEDDDDDDDDEELDVRPEPWFHKGWRLVKECFLVVINVDNLYDEDGMIMTNASTASAAAAASETPTTPSSPSPTRRNHLVVFFWFCILAISYGLERSSFKLLVDRAGPFRLFSVLMVTAVHVLILGMGMGISAFHRRQERQRGRGGNDNFSINVGPLGIPLVDVGLMALLDTLQILLVFISALHVPPTFSVILVQFTLPFAAILTQFVRPNGRCGYMFRRHESETSHHSYNSSTEGTGTPSPTTNAHASPNHNHNHNNLHVMSHHQTTSATAVPTTSATIIQPGTPLVGWGGLSAEHLWGSIIITGAVMLALFPVLYSVFNPAFFMYADPIPLQTAYNTLLYVSSCIPAAASQLYKESVFLHHKQPVDSNYLNLLLSMFQFIIASITAPLVYGLQGLGARKHWQHLYPPSTFSANFWDGLKCFFGLLDDDQALNDYADPAHCTFSFGLVLLHVLSIISVGVAVDKILQAGATKVMYRGISVGIFVAVLSMYTYDQRTPAYNYGPAMDSLTLACLLLLIVGAEVYHRVSLQDAAFETVYPEVENLYAAES